jgi:hypothetical protein
MTMDKLELALDDLEVDSFQANPEQSETQGTIQGQWTQEEDGCSESCTCDCPSAGCNDTDWYDPCTGVPGEE